MRFGARIKEVMCVGWSAVNMSITISRLDMHRSYLRLNTVESLRPAMTVVKGLIVCMCYNLYTDFCSHQ